LGRSPSAFFVAPLATPSQGNQPLPANVIDPSTDGGGVKACESPPRGRSPPHGPHHSSARKIRQAKKRFSKAGTYDSSCIYFDDVTGVSFLFVLFQSVGVFVGSLLRDPLEACVNEHFQGWNRVWWAAAAAHRGISQHSIVTRRKGNTRVERYGVQTRGFLLEGPSVWGGEGG